MDKNERVPKYYQASIRCGDPGHFHRIGIADEKNKLVRFETVWFSRPWKKLTEENLYGGIETLEKIRRRGLLKKEYLNTIDTFILKIIRSCHDSPLTVYCAFDNLYENIDNPDFDKEKDVVRHLEKFPVKEYSKQNIEYEMSAIDFDEGVIDIEGFNFACDWIGLGELEEYKIK